MARVQEFSDDLVIVCFASFEEVWFRMARAIREEVFVHEQQVSVELEYDHEEESIHYLLMIGDQPRATARWRETPHGIKLERFAVPREFRNMRLGTILLKCVIKDVLPKNREIYLHAQVPAVNYYARAGFVCEGDLFCEAGIAHYRMRYAGV